MSETPRAEAERIWDKHSYRPTGAVPVAFARQLERELTAVTEERDRLRGLLDKPFLEKLEEFKSENARLRALLDEAVGALEDCQGRLEYYRKFMPFCLGMPEEEYADTQEAKNADRAISAARDTITKLEQVAKSDHPEGGE